MVDLNKIINFLDETLHSKEMDDYSNNGLQVGKNKTIKKMGFSVDATLSTFKKSKDCGCDLLITHHGISFKDSLKYITGLAYEQINYLMSNDLALAAYHLPLDKHNIHGNNVLLAKMMKLKKIKSFDKGYISGVLAKKATTKAIAKYVENELGTICKIYEFGNKLNSSLSICSGRGSSIYHGASKEDCFLTGEIGYESIIDAEQNKKNIIIAGHYETESIGLKSLMKLIKREFRIEVEFISGFGKSN